MNFFRIISSIYEHHHIRGFDPRNHFTDLRLLPDTFKLDQMFCWMLNLYPLTFVFWSIDKSELREFIAHELKERHLSSGDHTKTFLQAFYSVKSIDLFSLWTTPLLRSGIKDKLSRATYWKEGAEQIQSLKDFW